MSIEFLNSFLNIEYNNLQCAVFSQYPSHVWVDYSWDSLDAERDREGVTAGLTRGVMQSLAPCLVSDC